MNYQDQSILSAIRKYYSIEVEIVNNNLPSTFFRKSNTNQYLCFSSVSNSENEIIIYFFKSDNEHDHKSFIEDFDSKDIAFSFDSLESLEFILEANDRVG